MPAALNGVSVQRDFERAEAVFIGAVANSPFDTIKVKLSRFVPMERLGIQRVVYFKEHAHNGLATALRDGVFLYRLETRLRGLCAIKEHAHNGLATALRDCVFLYRLETRLRGLCAIKEHAHNGLATALRDCVFLYRLETRLRGLCALTSPSGFEAARLESFQCGWTFEAPHSPTRREKDT